MNRRLVTGLALTTFVVWAGCTAFDDAVLPDRSDVTTEAGTSSSSSSSSSGDSGSGCKKHTPPERPATPSKPGGDIEIVLVVREIHFGINGSTVRKDFGYDLDGVCSCKEDPGSCTPRAGAPDGGICDGDEGRDDGLGQMVASLVGLGVTDPAIFANDSFKTGERSILMRIQNYNGEPNDDEIRFALYRTQVTTKPPTFAPGETWKVNEDDIAIGATADPYEPISFSGGYVRDGELVVNDLVTSRIPFNGDADLLLKQVRFTGKLKLDATSSRWNLTDVIGVGRWPLEDALRTVARVRDPNNDNKTRLCENSGLMFLARAKICSAADIASASADDRQTPPRPCSAVSAAVSFVTVPSAIDGTYPTKPDTSCAGKDIGTCD